MATTQAQLIQQTIINMKRALNRSSGDSDSDESIAQTTNRSNKLKRKANFVQEGRLDLPNGPKVYKRKLEHAGFKRDVIFKNPVRIDEEGFELEPDEHDDFADSTAAEENPYLGTKLEVLLRPLTSASELPIHPSLSVPYYSEALPQILNQVSAMVRHEKAALWRIKKLFSVFAGDSGWFPCGIFETENDASLFQPLSIQSSKPSSVKSHMNGVNQSVQKAADSPSRTEPTNGQLLATDTLQKSKSKDIESQPIDGVEAEASRTEVSTSDHATTGPELTTEEEGGASAGLDGVSKDKSYPKIKTEDESNGSDQQKNRSASEATTERGDGGVGREAPADQPTETAAQPNGDTQMPDASDDRDKETPKDAVERPADQGEEIADAEEDASESQPVAHRMRTRAQAQAASENNTANITRSQSPALSDIPQVHPIFLPPETALPDRSLGLPPAEADQMQRVLWQYVQKQEEICRNAESLYEGLLKADRLRKTVLKWSKAEAHVGEMSDGEDWYDKEEWGLEDDLKKGHEEDEDDGNQGKKTRGRRA